MRALEGHHLSDPAISGLVLVTAHAWYGDMIGGSFRLASEFAEYLAGVGYEVVYVCCDVAPERGLPATEVVHGVEVRRYRQPVRGGGRPVLHVSRAARVVREVLAERRIVALSGHSPLQFLGAALALRGSGTFRNYTVHSPFDDELRCVTVDALPLGTRVAARAAWVIERINLHLADRVQTNSTYTLDTMSAKHRAGMADKGVVAPGWVDVGWFKGIGDTATARQGLGGAWATEDPIFFTLRRLEARMGIDVLIRAAARVSPRLPFRVLIGGGGPEHPALARLIEQEHVQNRVHLLGRLPAAVVPVAYGAADCFVLPTRTLECFGLIVLEAFAAGRPVIAARTAAIPELASRQGDGWMFAPGSDVELAERLEAFLSGRLRVTANLQDLAAQFDRSQVMPLWERLLRQSDGALPLHECAATTHASR